MIISIWLYVHFMSGEITIRYIFDTHHLNIICIISYYDIFTLFLALLLLQHICCFLISLHRTARTSGCLLFLFTINLTFLRPVEPRLFTVIVWLYRILRQHRTARTSGCLLFFIHYKFDVLKTGWTTTIHGYRLIISHTPPTPYS